MNLPNCFALVGVSLFVAAPCFAAPSFADVEELWQQSKSKPGYVEYRDEFVQYNNHFHLDTKDDCFAQNSGPVNMYLIVTTKAVVESVVTDIDNARARCFKRTYTGLRVKAPPFSPFIINLRMRDK